MEGGCTALLDKEQVLMREGMEGGEGGCRQGAGAYERRYGEERGRGGEGRGGEGRGGGEGGWGGVQKCHIVFVMFLTMVAMVPLEECFKEMVQGGSFGLVASGCSSGPKQCDHRMPQCGHHRMCPMDMTLPLLCGFLHFLLCSSDLTL